MILILGGTTEAAQLARELSRLPGRVVTSLAGRTRAPAAVSGEVRVGAFGDVGELAAYVVAEQVTSLVDATHPFAARISRLALDAAQVTGVRLLRLERPCWVAQPGDHWHRVADMPAAADLLPTLGNRVLATTGHADAELLGGSGCRVWLRCIDAPPVLDARVQVILARGPFTVADELALLRELAIEVLVTKDSGGDATRAKLDAARELALPVVMIDRPPVDGEAEVVHSVTQALAWLRGEGR